MTELETSARPERKRMTNHNTPQLSGMDSANHCAAFRGLSALSTTTIRKRVWPVMNSQPANLAYKGKCAARRRVGIPKEHDVTVAPLPITPAMCVWHARSSWASCLCLLASRNCVVLSCPNFFDSWRPCWIQIFPKRRMSNSNKYTLNIQ
jgi:hypothetical protein